MKKFVAVILCALLSVTYAEVKGQYHDLKGHDNLAAHTDDYITINRIHYKNVLDGYGNKLQEFEQSYLGRLNTVTINREFLVKSVVKSNERWDPMVVLSDTANRCIDKYLHNIPTVEATRAAVNKCHKDYSEQLSILLEQAAIIRDVLPRYIASYNEQVAECGKKFDKSTPKYIYCVSVVTGKTNDLVISNEKDFQTQLEAAECTAKANIKSAIDCSYTVQVQTHTLISEAEVLIDACLLGKDECKPCADYTCSESFDVSGQIKNKSIFNPFYGRSDNLKCIMLSA